MKYWFSSPLKEAEFSRSVLEGMGLQLEILNVNADTVEWEATVDNEDQFLLLKEYWLDPLIWGPQD